MEGGKQQFDAGIFMRLLPFLESAVLLLLVFIYIARLGEKDYILNFLRIALVCAFWVVAFWPKATSWKLPIKYGIVGLLVVLTLVTATSSRIYLWDVGIRDQIGKHDGAMMTEIAYDLVGAGKNPYVENYYGTDVETYASYITVLHDYTVANPALEHYIYLPGMIGIHGLAKGVAAIFSLPQDARIAYLVLYLATIGGVLFLVRHHLFGLTLFMLFALNPYTSVFLAEGRNDYALLFFIVAMCLALLRKKYVLAGVAFGIALSVKQLSWLLIPFLLMYFSVKIRDGESRVTRRTFFVATGIIACCILLPFFFWDMHAFIDDTILYASSTSSRLNYPINGVGFSPLVALVAGDPLHSFPFWIPMGVMAIGSFVLGWFMIKKERALSSVLATYALSVFVVLMFSKFFHDNYLIYILQSLVLAAAVYMHESKKDFHEAKSPIALQG